MKVEKRTIGSRDFWFTIEHVYKEEPDSGDFVPTGRYYCAFSTSEPGAMIRGEVLKDDRGRARLFRTPEEALAAGIHEVESRLRLPARAYSVGLPYAHKPQDLDAYLRLLREQGIDGGTRAENSSGRQWPHVWTDRSQAEQFASRLRQMTVNGDWEVYDLSPPRSLADGDDGRAGPVEVLVGRQADGTTYGLHPNSLKRILQRFPQVHPRPTVFIGGDTRRDMEASRASVYGQVATILTGLSIGQLDELGGYRVVDPLTDLALYQSETVAG